MPALPASLAPTAPPLAAFLDFLSQDLSGATWTYGLVAGVVALDSFFPVAPSEAIVLAAAVLAGQGKLLIWAVILAAWAGAIVGDNVSYGLGSHFGDWLAPKLFRGERGRKALDWAKRQITWRPFVIIIARFIAGGRTATTFASGWLDLSWRRFIRYDVIAGGLWALVHALLGYFGGQEFEHSTWKALVVAAGVAGALTLVLEVGRRLYERRHPVDDDAEGAPAPA